MESKIHHDKIELLSRLIKDKAITKEEALLLLTDEGNDEVKQVIDPQPFVEHDSLLNNAGILKTWFSSTGTNYISNLSGTSTITIPTYNNTITNASI